MQGRCKALLLATLGVALAGCASNEPQIATCYGIAPASGEMDQCVVTRRVPARQYLVERQLVQSQVVAYGVRDTCTSYGLQPGTVLYDNCLVREADARRPTDYASHFDHPGLLYDQIGNRVDRQGYLIDRWGQRIGGMGYWVNGAGTDIVPPGTYVDASGRPSAAAYRSYPYSRSP